MSLAAPFRPLFQAQTYRDLLFLTAGIPIAAAVLGVLIAGWTSIAVLAVTPLVVPFLVGFRATIGLLARADAGLARALLGVAVDPPISSGGRGFWGRGKAVLADPSPCFRTGGSAPHSRRSPIEARYRRRSRSPSASGRLHGSRPRRTSWPPRGSRTRRNIPVRARSGSLLSDETIASKSRSPTTAGAAPMRRGAASSGCAGGSTLSTERSQ